MQISPQMEILLRMVMHRVQVRITEMSDAGKTREEIIAYYGGPGNAAVIRAVSGIIAAHKERRDRPPPSPEELKARAEREAKEAEAAAEQKLQREARRLAERQRQRDIDNEVHLTVEEIAGFQAQLAATDNPVKQEKIRERTQKLAARRAARAAKARG